MSKSIITVSGSSAVGKSFYVDAITSQFPEIREVIGLTSRGIREGEINGKSGIFMTVDELDELERKDKLVLIKEFFGYKYAWYKDDLINSDESRIINISYNSIQDLRDMGLNLHSIFIKPESEEIIKNVLNSRSLNEKEYEKRILGYYESIEFLKSHGDLFDLIFVNNYDEESRKKMLLHIKDFLESEKNKKDCKLTLKPKH